MNELKASVLMRHEVGLHARPSVKLTKLAKAFESKIDLGLSPDGPWIDAKSIVKVMATKAPRDSTIYFRAEGNDAKAALEALVTLVDGDFQDGRWGEPRVASRPGAVRCSRDCDGSARSFGSGEARRLPASIRGRGAPGPYRCARGVAKG